MDKDLIKLLCAVVLLAIIVGVTAATVPLPAQKNFVVNGQ